MGVGHSQTKCLSPGGATGGVLILRCPSLSLSLSSRKAEMLIEVSHEVPWNYIKTCLNFCSVP